MKSIILTLLSLYVIFHIAAFFINRHDNAEVWLNDCFEAPKKDCTVYKGKLRQSFIKQDYIITVDGNDIYLPKEQVGGTKWESTSN
ncbi:hypothetical protein UL135_002700 [Acinetobacter baumannii]|uniref:hypothetical protein n=1 Tax=Acinetobacter TaxID=469 RepID=UPI0013CF6073|nr:MULTISPECIES: hypothetical protein [Acinetobacter]ELZ3581734.1 hypothetical protein [Acinetobacter baumannii]ELZ3585872.1 hypothetical protein [Acinetobacter baumannii]MDD2945004.1 hypothetical protein [Acinetobacter sp.]